MPVKLEKLYTKPLGKADDPLKALLSQMTAFNASQSGSSEIWKPTPVYASQFNKFNKDNQTSMPLHARTQVLRSPVDCDLKPRFGVFIPERQLTSDLNAGLTPRTLPTDNVEMVQQKETENKQTRID
jgi:hypothetical protein